MIDSDTIIRILHIDNDRDFASNFSRIFTQWKVFCVENSNEALEALEREEFDAIIAGCRLPRVNGFEFLEIMKDRFPHIPLIFHTGECDGQFAREAFIAGASDCLIKDLGNSGYIEKLKNAVESAIEKKKSEIKRHESEDRLQRVVESVQDIIYAASPEGKITYLNPAFEQITGWARDELIGKDSTLLIHPDEMSLARERLQRIIRGEKMAVVESRVRCKSGEYIVLESISSVKMHNGKVIEIMGIGRDVTMRKKIERSLRESEERFRSLSEQSLQGIYIIKDGKMIFANDMVCEITGYSQDEILNWAPGEVIKLVHPEDKDFVSKQMRRKQAGDSDVIPQYEFRIIDKKGEIKWLLLHSNTIRYEGGTALEAVIMDITKRKMAEEALRDSEKKFSTIFYSSPSAITISVISDGRFIEVNESFLRLTGYAREEVIRHTSIELNIWAKQEDRDIVTRELHDHGAVRNLEVEFRVKSGETRQGLFSGEVIHLGGKPYLLAVTHDISEIKQAQDALKETEGQLRQMQKMDAMGRLAGGVAHDFNNLLTVIIGYSALISRRLTKNDPLWEDIQEIGKAGSQASTLTRQLLAFSRKQVLQPRVLNINSVVANVEKMIRRLIGEDIELVSVLHPDLGQITADPGQIEQVIINLVVNARDAMPRGGRIIIETSNIELDKLYARQHLQMEPGSYIMLAVSDDGCGMDKETLTHVFEPFYTTKEKGKGTGLGLSTVYGIIKQSGGYIRVYSEPGRGTSFKIYMTRVEKPTEPTQEETPYEDLPCGFETILLVEDEDMVRKLIHSILQMCGYNVLVARNGGEAILICEQHKDPIQLMLTDIVMPIIDGPDLAKRLEGLRPDMKVIYMSGYTDNVIILQGILGSDLPFLQKPITPESLTNKVREVLGSASY
ncbi:MAG: PAS domain S-box protein [Candidatus Eremiobacteraeota bacterium]|nr:PAS domain S-box protein [Candidatus Eremiobacteraeota bacterium]